MVHVIAHNGGVEGHSPPALFIPDGTNPFVVLEFLRASGDVCWELFEVPVWPAAPNKWWDTKPIEKEET